MTSGSWISKCLISKSRPRRLVVRPTAEPIGSGRVAPWRHYKAAPSHLSDVVADGTHWAAGGAALLCKLGGLHPVQGKSNNDLRRAQFVPDTPRNRGNSRLFGVSPFFCTQGNHLARASPVSSSKLVMRVRFSSPAPQRSSSHLPLSLAPGPKDDPSSPSPEPSMAPSP